MSSLLDRIEERGRQEGFREGADQNRLENIRSLMETMKLTAKQAMEALRIPEAEQVKYIAKL